MIEDVQQIKSTSCRGEAANIFALTACALRFAAPCMIRLSAWLVPNTTFFDRAFS